MANQVVGTGSVEIIFDYEKNLKNMLSSIQKEWNKVDVSKRLDEIDKSLDNLTKKTNDNTKATNENAKAQKSKKDIAEVLKNQELMLEKAMKNSTDTQKKYIETLQSQVKNGQELTGWQKERIKLLKDEDKNQSLNNLTLSAMAFALKRAGDEMFNYTKNAVLFTAQLEKTMAVTGSVAGASKEEVGQLTDAMLEMGTNVPVKFQKISDSMYNMASAGLNTQEVLASMPQAMKLAVGVGEDLDKTTELLISTVKSFDMSFQDSPKILDVFANSVAKSMATVEKLQVSFARVAPVAKNAGVSFEETTAILSKLYDLGLKGSNAGTVLGNVMTRLTTFTDQSTKALKRAGLSTKDVSLEYNTMGESLAKITLAMKNNKLGAEQLQYIFGTRGKIITDFLGQLKGDSIDELTKSYDELVKSISDASGAVDKFYGGQTETAQMALDKLSNSIDLFKVAIGEANKSALVPFASTLADVINGVANLSRSNPLFQNFLGIITGGTAIIGKMISSLSSLGLAYIALKDLPWGAIIAQIGLFKTALFSFNPIAMAVAGAITAITVAMGFYIKSVNDKREADQNLVSGAESLRKEMEKNNGELNENVLLTTEQINAKEELEKQLKKEIDNTNSLSVAMDRYNAYIKDFEQKSMAIKSGIKSLSTEMEKHGGVLDKNIELTKEQNETKNTLELALGREIKSTEDLNEAIKLYNQKNEEAKSKNNKLKDSIQSLKDVMDKHNGVLDSNVTLTNDQIEAKKELEKYLGTEITNMNQLNSAMAEHTNQLNKNTVAKKANILTENKKATDSAQKLLNQIIAEQDKQKNSTKLGFDKWGNAQSQNYNPSFLLSTSKQFETLLGKQGFTKKTHKSIWNEDGSINEKEAQKALNQLGIDNQVDFGNFATEQVMATLYKSSTTPEDDGKGGGGGNDDEEKKKTSTPTPKTELELAQEYVNDYFKELKTTIEKQATKNITKLQDERKSLLSKAKTNEEKIKIEEEYGKKIDAEVLQSNLKVSEAQKNALRNINDTTSTIYSDSIDDFNAYAKKNKINLDPVKFQEAIGGLVSGEFLDTVKVEPINVTDVAKFTETAIENIKESFTSFNTYAKNINELSEIFEKSDDVNIKESAKRDIAKNIQKINDLNTAYKLEESKIDQEYNARLESAKTKEERDFAIIDWERKLSELNKTQKINIYKFMEDLEKNGSALAISNIGEGFLELYKINEENAKVGIENIKEKTNKMLKQLEIDIGTEEFNKILPDVSAIMSKFDLDGDFESYYKTLNSFLSNILSAKNEKLNSNLEKATKNMNDVFDNFINSVGDTSSLIDGYEEKSKSMSDKGRDKFKTAIKESINKITGNESVTDYLMRLMDSNIELFKSELQSMTTESFSEIEKTEVYKANLGEFKKSKKAIKGNENLTDAQLESEFLDKWIETAKNVIKEMENETTAREKFVDKMEKTINSLSSLSSALDQLASTTGSSALGGIASALSGGLGIATGVQTAITNVGVDAIAGIAGGLSAVSAGISLIQNLTDDSEIQADNEKNRQLWEDSISAMDEIKEALESNFSSLISYTMDLVKNTTPTTSNIKKGQSEIQTIATALANQNKNFSDIIYTSSHTGSRGIKGNKTIQRASGMDLQSLYSKLGYSGDVDTTATINQLKSFAEQLKSMNLTTFNDLFLLDNEGLEDFDLQQANFSQLSEQVQAYVDILEKAQSQVEQFAKLSTFSDFTGFEVSDIDELYQNYIDQYKEMGVTITDSIKDYLYALAEDNAITETITADVRDGFVSGWSQGQSVIESLSSSLETYFSGIMENLSKVYYDTVLDTFNTTLSEFYVNYMEALADIKTASGDITDFATSYDYSSILTAISDAQDLENTLSQVYATIRKQAESAGISGVLIDEMLGDEYRLTIRDNISSAVSSGIMDGFNDGDITEADIKNSIFSTIVEQAMTDIIDNIMSKNGVTSIVTQIVNALQSGDTAVLESLGISLTDSINAGLDESSATIEYLMGLLDKYSGENTDPIVFFDESNLESIQQSMKDYQDFSIQTKGLSSSVETTKRIEITISASGSLTNVELKAIAQQISEEVGLEVSTSKYI